MDGSIKKAESSLFSLYEKFNISKDIKGEVVVRINIGYLLTRKGYFVQALKIYKDLLKLTNYPNHANYLLPEKARIQVNIGELFAAANKPRKAIIWFNKCIVTSKSCHSAQNYIISKVKLGFIYLFQDNPDQSIKYFNSAYENSTLCHDELWKAESLRGKAVWNIYKANFNEANRRLNDALHIYRSHKDLTGISNVFESQGLYHNFLHNQKEFSYQFQLSAPA